MGTHDYKSLLKAARVIENQICYPDKFDLEIVNVFEKRHCLYRDIYNHKTNHAIEAMILDILKDTEGVIHKYLEVIYDWERYVKLDDRILAHISFTDDPRLKNAQNLIKRLQCRDMYSFVSEKVVPIGCVDRAKDLTEKDVAQYCEGLDPAEIRIRLFQANFSFGAKNPMDFIKFYNYSVKGKYLECYHKNFET